MRAHTRKHHIEKQETLHEEDDQPLIWNDELFKEWFGDRPKASVHLSGLRHREDLTQVELGKLLGISQTNISAMERGKRPIGKQLAKRLGTFFKIDYRLFL